MSQNETLAGVGSRLWALLIGINEYRAVTNLRGCVNDIEATQVFLTERLAVPESQIKVLLDAAATRNEILRTFLEFLVDNAAITPGDQILIQFSGHGSQMPNVTGNEPDGLDETLVAHALAFIRPEEPEK
jgi:uncharacterized caspase-like protein